MIYRDTVANIQMLMHSCVVLEREQIIRFFSSHHTQEHINFFIDTLIQEHILDADETNPKLVWKRRQARKTYYYTPEYIRDHTRAFWVPASFGCDNIKDIQMMDGLHHFVFVSHMDEIYDVTTCETKEQGRAASIMRAFLANKVPNYIDDVNHIVVVPSEEVGKELDGLGFDSYCWLDKNHVPKYAQW